MPFRKIPNLDCSYAMISFEANGSECPEEIGLFSNAVLAKVKQENYTNIFLLTHGWKGDVPSAIDQFDRWVGAMWKREADRTAMGAGFKPLFIGLHWPSQPWVNDSDAAACGP